MRHAGQFLCAFGFAAALVLAGCGGEDDGMEPTNDAGEPTGDAGGMTGGDGGSAATWTQVWNTMDGTCNTPTCHGSAATQGGLDLSTKQTAYDAMVGVEAGGAGSMCGGSGLMIVQSGNPDQSLLVGKLEEKAGMGDVCGAGMPSTGDPLTREQINAVRSWIANGAPNN